MSPLRLLGSIGVLCDDSDIFDTGGNFTLGECNNQSYNIYQTRASGGVLSQVEGRTYILTADHFCDTSDISQIVPRELEDYIEISRKIRKDGDVHDFKIEKQNKQKDLCLISSETYQVESRLRLAKSMPEVGEVTTTISSPLGVSENGVNLHFSGTFSGCNSFTCFFTIPAISGSSGSLVLNYDKEVVGMTQRSLVGFPEVTIGVGIYDITDFIREFEEESGNRHHTLDYFF